MKERMNKIPLIDVEGTPFEAGEMLGSQLRSTLEKMTTLLRERVESYYPGGWAQFLTRTKIYSAYVENFLPNDHKDMLGISEGSGLKVEELYALTCLELREELKGCTDFSISGTKTKNQHTLVCHNEDWNVDEQKFLVVRRSKVKGEPRTISVAYGGIIPSIGFNDSGLALSGNALSPNDKQFGIPKLHIVREILRCKTMESALKVSDLKPRASSFNNVITSSNGQIYNFEGTATAHDLFYSSTYSAHTNHYASPLLKRFEENPEDVYGSVLRYNTIHTLLEQNKGSFDIETCKGILKNHSNSPDGLCKHSQSDGRSCTVFSAIMDLTDLGMHLAWGNPCETTDSDWHYYSFGDE